MTILDGFFLFFLKRTSDFGGFWGMKSGVFNTRRHEGGEATFGTKAAGSGSPGDAIAETRRTASFRSSNNPTKRPKPGLAHSRRLRFNVHIILAARKKLQKKSEDVCL